MSHLVSGAPGATIRSRATDAGRDAPYLCCVRMRRDHEPSIGAMLRIPLAGCIVVLALTGCGSGPSSTPATVATSVTGPHSARPTATTATDSIALAAARDRKWLLASSYTPDRYEVSQLSGGTKI